MKKRIKQAYVSTSVRRFKDRWFKMFNLEEYDNPNEPAVFFYNIVKDLDIILKHKTNCVVVITSSHEIGLDFAAKELNKENIKILATSRISPILTEMGVKSEWPGCGIFVEKVEPVKLGDKIYSYLPILSGKKSFTRYGEQIINKINTKYEIITGDGSVPMDRWYECECQNYYNKVFIGLNLADGSAGQTSVVDLGLRGIPCVTNVTTMPHTISWNTIEDIEISIELASQNIGKINFELAKKVYESMDYKQNWLEIEI